MSALHPIPSLSLHLSPFVFFCLYFFAFLIISLSLPSPLFIFIYCSFIFQTSFLIEFQVSSRQLQMRQSKPVRRAMSKAKKKLISETWDREDSQGFDLEALASQKV